MNSSPTILSSWLHETTRLLKDAGIATARLDCLVLLEDVLNTNRTHILAHPERKLTEVEERNLDKMAARRAEHVPLAYIRGKTEFYGREFTINQSVLEPRPESEAMIDILKDLGDKMLFDQSTVIDIGTGSGALAITAKLELPRYQVYATDIDQKCLQQARRNAKLQEAPVTFLSGDLLQPFEKDMLNNPLVLLCNLPYVPNNFQINMAATHEPRHAIFGGQDGLDMYRRLFQQLVDSPSSQPRVVLCESLPPQHPPLQLIAEQADFELVEVRGLVQCFNSRIT